MQLYLIVLFCTSFYLYCIGPPCKFPKPRVSLIPGGFGQSWRGVPPVVTIPDPLHFGTILSPFRRSRRRLGTVTGETVALGPKMHQKCWKKNEKFIKHNQKTFPEQGLVPFLGTRCAWVYFFSFVFLCMDINASPICTATGSYDVPLGTLFSLCWVRSLLLFCVIICPFRLFACILNLLSSHI